MEEGRRYRVLGVLGRGGFGTVFRAELLGDGAFVRPVALKVLNPAVADLGGLAARLRDEARLLGRIRHRAVVQVDGLVRIDERWTVVMEFIDGVDLGRVIGAGAVPPRAALEVVGEVASALHVAHFWPGDDGAPLGLLHRDIKPGNVMVTAAGEVKVVDFGVARAEGSTREARSEGMRFGSPGYVAPERMEGDERPAGDVYSLGVVGWELLSGQKLERPSVRRDRSEAHVAAALNEIAAPEAAVALVREMLAWDPSARPSPREVERRCRELVAELKGPFLRDWAEVAVPPLLASSVLGDASDSFSSEIVTEGRAVPSVPPPVLLPRGPPALPTLDLPPPERVPAPVPIAAPVQSGLQDVAGDLSVLGAVVLVTTVLTFTIFCCGLMSMGYR